LTSPVRSVVFFRSAPDSSTRFLYSLAFGQQGAERVIQILHEEMVTGMRLLGVTRLDQLCPEMVKFPLLAGLWQNGRLTGGFATMQINAGALEALVSPHFQAPSLRSRL
jgi:hypothetical protein